ncbi:MAG TPA: glycosyltransferase family 4 protein [Terriglobales bacterium]|nr:glycosyltransferase family 4 protein [Terriglobales bacterium]
MRVLTYTSLFPNNLQPAHGVFIYQRMSHFARRGNEVTVVAPVPYFPSWLPGAKWNVYANVPRKEQIGNLTVYHPRYPLIPKISMPLHGLFMFLGSYGTVRRLCREMQFDGIDAHYVYPDGLAAVLLGKIFNLPVILSARGTDMNLFPKFRTIRPMIRWTLQRVAGAIGVCTPLQDAMLQSGLAPEKATVIGNGVDTTRFYPVDRVAARERLKIPEDAQVLVSVGGLIERKGFHFLIPAVAQIAARYPRVNLYMVGSGEWQAKLDGMIKDLGLQDRVFLVGPQPNEELKFWYSAADVSCLTSSREGWPNVLLESMACGTPPVATRVWGTPEVITSADLGVMVDQTADSIAAGLEIALTKNWNRDMIQQYASRRTWDVVAGEVEQFFQSKLQPAAHAAAVRTFA